MSGFSDWEQGVQQQVAGTGTDPGQLGIGMYKVDPNASQIPGYSDWQSQMQSMAQGAQGVQAPQLNQQASDQSRGLSMGVANQLQAQANGTAPSLAQNQLRQGADTNISQAMAMAQANPQNGSSLLNIANQRANIGAQTAGQAANLRLQEQQGAQQQLASLAQGMRSSDLSASQSNANLTQQQTAQNNQAVQFYLSQGMSMSQAQQQANMQQQNLQLNAYNDAASQRSGNWQFNINQLSNIGKSMGGAMTS